MLPLLASVALASDPVDIGVIKNEDIRVVQKVLYTKEGRLELGAHLGILPFDTSTFAPQLALTAASHFSESFGIEAQLGGGYGLKTAQYSQAEAIGVAPEAYRYLASVEVDAQYTPIYAKMNLGGRHILHNDVYLLAGVGGSLEQSVFPSADLTFAPTIPVGIGTRVWVSDKLAIRGELRDNIMVEYRKQSAGWYFKQNAAVTVGIAYFGKGKS